MRPVAGIGIRPLALFLDGAVRECLAASVLAEPDGLWGAVGEADHVVFPVWSVLQDVCVMDLRIPVTNVVAELESQDCVALVISI